MMDQGLLQHAREFLKEFAERFAERRQRRLEEMNGYFTDFMDDLLNYPLVRPWRESLDQFQEHYWQQGGMRLTSDSYHKVAALIERLVADPSCYAHGPIQPDATGGWPGQPTGEVAAVQNAAEQKLPEPPRPFVVSVVPNVSGPPESEQKSIAPSATFVNGLEVAGPGLETTGSYRAKVRAALDVLDPKVGSWWKANSVDGQVRSRAAGLLRFRYYTELERNNTPVIVVDQNMTAGQTAQAIIAEVMGGWAADSIGVFFKKYRFHRSKEPDQEFRNWQRGATREAAQLASVLAELYLNSIATLTPSGDLIVSLGDLAENGPRWDQLLSVLPLISLLPIGAIIIKTGKRQIKLPKKLARELEALSTEERKLLLARAAAATTDAEADSIIKQGIASRRAPEHHIATSRNEISTLRGGPWTPKFEKLFKKAGMTLEAAENKVRLPGHKGPHSREYHEAIYDRLTQAVKGLSGEEYKQALVDALERVSREIKTPGTQLHRLLIQ